MGAVYMKKITKKEFIAKLKDSQNVLITSGLVRSDKKEQMKKSLLLIADENIDGCRTVKKVQPNGIQFSNDSWLSFGTVGKHTYYMYGSFLIAETVNDGFYSYIVYFVKPL